MHWIFFVSILLLTASCESVESLTLDVKKDLSMRNDERTEKQPSDEVPKKSTICDVCECHDAVINCTARQLTHNFADTLWPKIPLQLVTFEGNSIVYLKQFPNVTIEKLILSRNRITKIDDRAFKWIKNLTELDMSHNHLTSKILRPEVFEGRFSVEEWEPLKKLRTLSLSNNNLHTLNQDLFEHITELTDLNLSGNPFSIVDHGVMTAFYDLTDVEKLDLSFCDLKDLPDHFFHAAKLTLKRLYLNGNRFTFVPSALEEATSLEYLNLDENPFTGLDRLNGFPSLPTLKTLTMSSLPYIMKIGHGSFSGLTALEELYLEDCPKLSEIDEEALLKQTSNGAIWPPLKHLDLSNNALKYLPADLITHWDKLDRLAITNNDWVCDCDNQYLVGELLPTLGKTLMGDDVNRMFCAAPPEHAGKNMSSLANRQLRCLDYYGARPERDAAILLGLMIGLVLAVPIVMTLILLWRRGFIFYNNKNPASFSRAYYKRATNDEDF